MFPTIQDLFIYLFIYLGKTPNKLMFLIFQVLFCEYKPLYK